MNNKKLAVIGTVGVPSSYGGFETLVENLLDHFPEDLEVTVFCQSSAYSNKIATYKDANLNYINIGANGVSSILYDVISILKSFRKFDVLLILGVSGSIVLPLIKPFFKGKIIINIDGLEWKRDKWNFFAKKFLKFSESLATQFSDVIVADNRHIQKYVLHEYNKQSVLIGYGGNHVHTVTEFSVGLQYGLEKEKYFFTVCRIEPENNLDLMVLAYNESKVDYPYLIIGNFNSSKYGIEFREKFKDVKGLILQDPIYDQNILDQFRSNCFFYLHGHSAGGTNPSLVEAMYLELPVIAYGVSYNRASTFDSAVYFDSQAELVKIFKNIYAIERIRLKAKMRLLAEENYTWELICAKYNKLFI